MKLTLTGIARVLPHDTQKGQRVPRLAFTADQAFEAADRIYQPDHFDAIAYGENLLDWKNAAVNVAARD